MDETMPDETELDSLAELFKVFGDPTRIRILFVLFETEVCGGSGKMLNGDSSRQFPISFGS